MINNLMELLMDDNFFIQPIITSFAMLLQYISEILTVIVLCMQGYYIYTKTRKVKEKKED